LRLSPELSARLALVPWLSLSFLLTGCPLSDNYSLLPDGAGGGAGDAGGSDAAGGSDLAAGASGASSAQSGGGNSGAPNAGSGGISGTGALGGGSAGDAGTPDQGGEAGQAPVGGGAGFGGSNTAGTGGTTSAGSGGDSNIAGSSGASGSAGAAATCSAPSCGLTCCASIPSGPLDSCVDTTRDFENCGACGVLCNKGRTCGASACQSGWVGMSAPPVGFVARWRAASVAMDKSVFVWGGSDSAGGVLDSGAIYSPATDSWTAIAKDAYTPTARVLATAVWTGSVVVVLGGSDASGATPYKDGAIYDPAKNAWSGPITAAKARSAPLGFWDGTRAIFWGGLGATAAAVSGAERFDATSAWSASSSTVTGDPGAILNPAAGWDGATLYLQGGTLAGARTANVYSYTASSDAWASLAKSLSARSNSFGAWDGARFVVWGGTDNFGLRSDGAKYQPGTGWAALATTGVPSARLAIPRRHGWSFSTSPGVVAFFGGETSTFGAGTFATAGATYDVVNAKWTAAAAWPSGELHDYGVAVWTGEEFVLWGGRTGTSLAPTVTGERWKP
jgi:hypothetical protein